MSHPRLLALGLVVLIAADLVLATNDHWGVVLAGIALWGIRMGITQGLLATMEHLHLQRDALQKAGCERVFGTPPGGADTPG